MTRKTILLVEDHEDNRNIYRTILEHSGYAVVVAPDGREAIRMARESRPDLILMDIAIPHIDGFEVTRLLKGDGMTASIPIVALTAHSLPEDRARARQAGCDGYLAKPVAPVRVMEEVRRWIGAPGSSAPVDLPA